MELNEYQKQVLLSMLNDRVIEEQHLIDKLNQTISHNENWIIPLTQRWGDIDNANNMKIVVKNAKKVIDTNEKDLIQIKEFIEKIKNLVIN